MKDQLRLNRFARRGRSYLLSLVVFALGASPVFVLASEPKSSKPGEPVPMLAAGDRDPSSGAGVTAEGFFVDPEHLDPGVGEHLQDLAATATAVTGIAVESHGSTGAQAVLRQVLGESSPVAVYDDENDFYVQRQKRNQRIFNTAFIVLRIAGITGGVALAYIVYNDFNLASFKAGLQGAAQSGWLQAISAWFYPWLISPGIRKINKPTDAPASWIVTYVKLFFVNFVYMLGIWGRAYQNGLGVDETVINANFMGSIASMSALEMAWDREIAEKQAEDTARDPRNRYWYQTVADFKQAAISVLSTTAGAFSGRGSLGGFVATGFIFGAGYLRYGWEFRHGLLSHVLGTAGCAARIAWAIPKLLLGRHRNRRP